MKDEEKITVTHRLGDEENEKQINYSWNNFNVGVYISGTGDYFGEGVSIFLQHTDCEAGVRIKANVKKGKIFLSLDDDGGIQETKARDYNAWIDLEQVELALKIIGRALK